MTFRSLVLIVFFLMLAGWAGSSQAQLCDQEGGCVTLTLMGSDLYAEVEPSDPSKAKPGYGGVTVVDLDPDTMPILLDAFNNGGFGCFGGISPSLSSPASGGTTQGTSMTCGFQNSNGDTWRVTITITWAYNAANGRWEIANMEATAKLIKSQFQNQVE